MSPGAQTDAGERSGQDEAWDEPTRETSSDGPVPPPHESGLAPCEVLLRCARRAVGMTFGQTSRSTCTEEAAATASAPGCQAARQQTEAHTHGEGHVEALRDGEAQNMIMDRVLRIASDRRVPNACRNVSS